jgi:protein TonB
MAKSILVVDYDPKRIETTTRPFTEAGYRVEVARDGVAGVEAFARLHPDLVLVEMMLPKRHGFEVCQEFRKLRPGKKTPVLILGSTQAERYRMQAIGAGASDYLVRPVPDERLLEICRNLIEQPNQDLPPQEPKAPEPIRLEDSVPDFFKEPTRTAPAAAPKAATPEPAAPLLDLGGLSDDEISARLDALLPSETQARPTKAVPHAPAQVPSVQPVETSRSAPPRPRVEAPPAAPPKAPPPVAVPAERPAPRAKLPQAGPVLEPPVVETSKRPGIAWPVVAVVGLIAVIGGWYGWRAASSDGAVAEGAALDATDFAPVPRSAEPALAVPPAVESPPAESSSGPVFVEPEAAPVRLAPSTPAPIPAPPAPRTETSAPTPQRAEPVATPGPPVPQEPAPAALPAPSESGMEPVEEELALPSMIAPIEAIAAVPSAQPEPARPKAGTVRGSIVDLAEADSPPEALSRTAPAYPPVALRMRREGRVAVRLLVDENGTVADAVVADASAPADFAGEAVKAARNWRYRPAKKDGVSVKVWITEVIAFKL